ncbi:Uncharacterized protein Adt_44299 [Abeliophyllum distichum]|uniref:Uncharacterized protein n=1 Tax=Abeliophyllum distichum TaxID=126358 RepID=A0ABD1PAG7_9LAMI
MSSQGSSGSKKLHNFELPKLKWRAVSHPRNSTRIRKTTMRSPRQQSSPPAIAATPQPSQPINSVMRVQSSLRAVSPPFTNGLSNDEEKIVGNECVKVGELLPDSEKLAQNLAQKMEETVIVSSVYSAGGGQRNPNEVKELKSSCRRSRTSAEAGMVEGNRELPLIIKDKEKGKQLAKEDEGKIISLLKKDKEVNLSIKDDKSIKIGGADGKGGKKWNFRDRKSNQSSKTASAKSTAGSSSTSAGSKDKQPKHAGKSGLGKKEKEEREMSDFPKLPSFSLELKPEEIVADLLAMTGKISPKKPKKRTKNVQRQIDLIIPGINLETITIDQYRVTENTQKGT